MRKARAKRANRGIASITLALAAIFDLTTVYAQESDFLVIEEIVVTATKRSENMQDVPVAVTAMTGEHIQETGLQTIQQLTDLNASVSFDTAQSFQRNSLKIRGIGTIGNSRTFEGAVGVFIDGVYRSRSGMVLSDLLDIDRLEILRGPQGTLFGKNTVAGAIALYSTKPDLYELRGNAELRLGNFDARYFTGGVNVPIDESAALRFAATYNNKDGSFVSPDNGDEYDNTDRYSLKSQLLISPSDELEVWLIADYAKSDANCCWGSAQVFNGPTAPLIETYGTLNGLTFVPAPDAERDRAESLNTLPGEEIEDSGLTATIHWNLNDEISLKSVTAYRDWEHSQITADADFVPADLFVLNEPADIDIFSQEFNLSIVKDKMDLLVGAYYATEDYESIRSAETGADADNYLNALISGAQGATACLPPVEAADCMFPVDTGALLPIGEFTRERYHQESRSYAVFAHASTSLSEKFDLVAGLRYSVERKDGGVDNLFWYDSAIVRAMLATMGIPDDGTPRNGLDLIGTTFSPSFQDNTRDEEIIGTLSLQFYATNRTMLYGAYNRGYKAGGVNLFREGVVTNTTTYAPEFADSLEEGIKADYWDGRARTNVAVFRTEFSDLQINFFTGLEFRTENTAEATTQGMEIENQFQVTDELQIELSVTYLDSRFDQIDNPFLSYLVNRDTPRAPEWAGVLALTYERFIGGDMSFLARGLASYTGSHFVGTEVPTEQKVDSYIIADASLGLRWADSRWEALVWCSNCFDEDYRTIFFNSTFQPGSFNAYLNAPRQYGVTFRMNF